MKLYMSIKDDYLHQTIDEISEDQQINYAKHKMNVMLDICRDSSRVKKLSKIYDSEIHNPKLYSRYIVTLYSIHAEYIKILKAHEDYELHREKILNLYSGMRTIPIINSSKILIKHPIDTTLRPNGSFVGDNDGFYLNFKVKLDGLIIPIIGSCYAKFEELGWERYSHSEYEFLYIGICDLDCINYGQKKTIYKLSYQIYSRMNYFYNNNDLTHLLSEYIAIHGNLETALINIPLMTSQYEIQNFTDKLDGRLFYIKYKYEYSDNSEITIYLLDLLYLLFINNIINKSIVDNDSYNHFIYDMEYILTIFNSYINKVGFNKFVFINSLRTLLSFLRSNTDITIRELCKSDFLTIHDIFIENKYSPIYIVINNTECIKIGSLARSINNEYPISYKYLKYKNKYNSFINYILKTNI